MQKKKIEATATLSKDAEIDLTAVDSRKIELEVMRKEVGVPKNIGRS